MQCIVCGSSQAPGLAAWHARCPACEYESASLAVAINERAADEVDEADRETGLKALRLENFRVIVEAARRLAPRGGRRLLDVGSAHGWFLETARASFDVLGVEPDAKVGGKAAERGLPVRRGYFPDVLHEGESFDVIVFNDVIEHIPDIRAALASCAQRLNGDGILILNLPNSRGFFYRLAKLIARLGWRAPFERLWQKDLPSPHVHYFHSGNLARLVERYGFELIDSKELPSLRAHGLLERLRCAGDIPAWSLYVQYFAVLAAIPMLRLFSSDIIVCIFRKKAASESSPAALGENTQAYC